MESTKRGDGEIMEWYEAKLLEKWERNPYRATYIPPSPDDNLDDEVVEKWEYCVGFKAPQIMADAIKFNRQRIFETW